MSITENTNSRRKFDKADLLNSRGKVVFHKLKHLHTGQIKVRQNEASILCDGSPEGITMALNNLSKIIVEKEVTLIDLIKSKSDDKIKFTAKFIKFEFIKE